MSRKQAKRGAMVCRFLFWVILTPLAPAIAELPPDVYETYQADAPELIHIEVLRVKRPIIWFSRTTPITLSARVVSVQRSQSNLKEGDSITITYETYRPPTGWAGPRPIPILTRGRLYRAYLVWSDQENAYVPAARGRSFE